MTKKKGNELNTPIDLEEEKEVKANILKFQPKLITGGKGPSGKNWLSSLRETTIFLTKPIQSGGFALGQFHLMHKLDNAVHLMDNLQGETHIWVDPDAFCNQFKLVAILYEPNDTDD